MSANYYALYLSICCDCTAEYAVRHFKLIDYHGGKSGGTFHPLRRKEA